jgi:hypothetical protein
VLHTPELASKYDGDYTSCAWNINTVPDLLNKFALTCT